MWKSPFIRPLIIAGFAVATYCQCTPPNGELVIEAAALHAYDGSPVEDMQLTLEQRVLSDGVLNGNYETAASATTGTNGNGTLKFQRVNALDYRLSYDRPGWFSVDVVLNPDVFLDDAFLHWSEAITPRAEVTIRLLNVNPFDANDAIQFRTLNVPGSYPTCSNVWETHVGMDIDATRSCSIEADRFLPYTYTVIRNGESTPVLDSIWVAAPDTTHLPIYF